MDQNQTSAVPITLSGVSQTQLADLAKMKINCQGTDFSMGPTLTKIITSMMQLVKRSLSLRLMASPQVRTAERPRFMRSSIHWLYLLAAGLFEIGWPLGLTLAANPAMKVWGLLMACVCMGISGFLLLLALRGIPIGTAYAVWTGIGAAGTFMVGMVFFGDPSLALRWLGLGLIVAGVVCLKLA